MARGSISLNTDTPGNFGPPLALALVDSVTGLCASETDECFNDCGDPHSELAKCHRLVSGGLSWCACDGHIGLEPSPGRNKLKERELNLIDGKLDE